MATIYCPHCGKEIFDELLECPNCHGPIEKNVENVINEVWEKRNKKEKNALIACGIIALIFVFYMSFAAIGSGTFDGGMIFAWILICIFVIPMLMCFFYGVRWGFQWAKKTAFWGFILIPVVGWFAGLGIICAVGGVAGFVITPMAVFNWITKKPIVSKEKIMKELSK